MMAMTQVAALLVVIVLSIPAHAGFKFFGADGQYMAPAQEDNGHLLSMSGAGHKSQMVELHAGAHAVHFDCRGALGIRLRNNKGMIVRDLSTSKPGAGGATWGVSNSGWHTIEVEGDGDWRVQLDRGYYSEPAQPAAVDVQSQTYPVPTPQVIQRRPAKAEDDVDMTGIEWRQSRGAYSGRAAKDMTRKFGYRAGEYLLEYRYKAHRHFAIWMHSRRGLHELLVNRVGSADTELVFVLPKDDEIWFEVHSPFGNWEFTVERVR